MKLRAVPAHAPRPAKLRPRHPARAAQEQSAGRAYRQRLRAEAFDHYGWHCERCNKNNSEQDLCIVAPAKYRSPNGQAKLVALKRAGWPDEFVGVLCRGCLW